MPEHQLAVFHHPKRLIGMAGFYNVAKRSLLRGQGDITKKRAVDPAEFPRADQIEMSFLRKQVFFNQGSGFSSGFGRRGGSCFLFRDCFAGWGRWYLRWLENRFGSGRCVSFTGLLLLLPRGRTISPLGRNLSWRRRFPRFFPRGEITQVFRSFKLRRGQGFHGSRSRQVFESEVNNSNADRINPIGLIEIPGRVNDQFFSFPTVVQTVKPALFQARILVTLSRSGQLRLIIKFDRAVLLITDNFCGDKSERRLDLTVLVNGANGYAMLTTVTARFEHPRLIAKDRQIFLAFHVNGGDGRSKTQESKNFLMLLISPPAVLKIVMARLCLGRKGKRFTQYDFPGILSDHACPDIC